MTKQTSDVNLIVLLVAVVIVALSTPFMIIYTQNVYVQSIFGFGNFLMLLGGLIK